MNAWGQISWIASEALMHLEDSLVIAPLTAKDVTADFNTKPNGYAVGQSVNFKTRPEYEVRDFDADTVIKRQGVRESMRSMTIEKLYDVSIGITAREKSMNLESFSAQIIQPAVYALAEKCDRFIGTKILGASGLYVPSVAGALFSDAPEMAQARKAATLQQLSATGRFCLVDLDLEAKLLGANYFSTWNNRGPDGTQVFTNGMMGHAMGMDFYSSINFPTDISAVAQGGGTGLTNNILDGSGMPTVNLIGMSTLTFDGGTSMNTIGVGSRIRIAGVRRPLVVASTGTGAASGTVGLAYPISEIIPDNAAVSVIASGKSIIRKGAIFDDQSIAIAMPVLDTPSDKPSFVASSNGYSIRVVQGYDMETKKDTLSLDLLIGATCYDPRRITLLADW